MCECIQYLQWRIYIYIEAKEAVVGGPRTQGAPKFIKNKNKKRRKITNRWDL